VVTSRECASEQGEETAISAICRTFLVVGMSRSG
jgi:hypothetical protein